MQEQQPKNNFSILSQDALLDIASFLPLEDFVIFLKTSKEIKNQIDVEYAWKNYAKDFAFSYSRFPNETFKQYVQRIKTRQKELKKIREATKNILYPQIISNSFPKKIFSYLTPPIIKGAEINKEKMEKFEALKQLVILDDKESLETFINHDREFLKAGLLLTPEEGILQQIYKFQRMNPADIARRLIVIAMDHNSLDCFRLLANYITTYNTTTDDFFRLIKVDGTFKGVHPGMNLLHVASMFAPEIFSKELLEINKSTSKKNLIRILNNGCLMADTEHCLSISHDFKINLKDITSLTDQIYLYLHTPIIMALSRNNQKLFELFLRESEYSAFKIGQQTILHYLKAVATSKANDKLQSYNSNWSKAIIDRLIQFILQLPVNEKVILYSEIIDNGEYESFTSLVLNDKEDFIKIAPEINNPKAFNFLYFNALKENNRDIISLLLETNRIDNNAKVASYSKIIADFGYNFLCSFLLTNKEDFIDIATQINNAEDFNAIYYRAVRNNNRDIINLLLDTKRANINFVNNEGNSALHIAALENNHDLIILLTSRGIDQEIINQNGNKAFQLNNIGGATRELLVGIRNEKLKANQGIESSTSENNDKLANKIEELTNLVKTLHQENKTLQAQNLDQNLKFNNLEKKVDDLTNQVGNLTNKLDTQTLMIQQMLMLLKHTPNKNTNPNNNNSISKLKY